MKQRFITLFLGHFLFFFSFLYLSAQGIIVTNFSLAEHDLTANLQGTTVYDQNGEKCALIKVRTTQSGFTFDAGLLGVTKTEQKLGEIWVYVPNRVKRLSIYHPQLGVLSDYDLGRSVQKGRTYILELTTGKVETVVQQTVMSQYLVFIVQPSDAVLRVNGEVWPVEEGIAQRFVSFGTYNYSVEALDHHTETGVAEVNNPNQKTEVTISLRPAYGWIEVGGNSLADGAKVYIDNRLVGQVPVKSERLPSGIHNVKVVMPMYKSLEQTVTVTDNTTFTLVPNLEADFAEVQLSTEDANAEIWINDEHKAIGTWRGKLMTGEYKLETRREHHRSQMVIHRFTPAAGVQLVSLSAPIPIYGGLNIGVAPSNAEVFMDGVSMGYTPLFMQQVLIGNHSLLLKKPNHGDFRRDVVVKEGQIIMVEGQMQDAVEVSFTSNVPNVTLKVDGVEVGPSEGNYTISYGPHRLEMEAEGFKPFSRDIEVKDDSRSFTLFMENLKQVFTVNGVSFTMVAVKGGMFQMGATTEQQKPSSEELPVHSVSLSDYYIGETEVTQSLWEAVMGENPSDLQNANCPVERVSWNDCRTFIKKLNQLTGLNFRLPTEAEWEYAARGGTLSSGYQYSGSNNLKNVAWYKENASKNIHPVKLKKPNELGIYDMSGNVWEWCQDYKGDYPSSAQSNPFGPISGMYRVYRGGSCDFDVEYCRIAYRNYNLPSYKKGHLGLRLALTSLNLTALSSLSTEKHNNSFLSNNKVSSLLDNKTYRVKGVTFTMVSVKGGTFRMGATPEQKKPYNDEKPVHSVTLSDFYIGETEVTQALWTAVMGKNPSKWKGDNLPVEQVSWDDCQTFVRELNQLTGESFRLPTEAEWEYAARGGNKSRGYQYSGSNSSDDVSWNTSNSGSKTHAVKTKQPNELGLYDMSGNVWEWCQDWYGDYSSSAQTNPTGPSSGAYRVRRGGSWSNLALNCRLSYRFYDTHGNRNNHLGFRLSLSVSSQK